MQKWAAKLEKIVAFGQVNLADLSGAPPFIRVPLERAAERGLGQDTISRFARFLIDEAERRTEEGKQIKKSWWRLLVKLGFAWIALLVLVWYQVQNIEAMMLAWYESPEPWFVWLSCLRNYLPIWGSLIPLLSIAMFIGWWRSISLSSKACWKEEDCSVLTDQLRGVKNLPDPTELSHMLLGVDSTTTSSEASVKGLELRSIGASFLTEQRRIRDFEWIQARLPAWISFAAMCGLVSAYLGLNLLPMFWMLDRYFRDLRP